MRTRSEQDPPVPSAASRQAPGAGFFKSPRVRWIGLGILLVLAVTWWREHQPLLPVPRPPNLAQLEPQLRDYLAEQFRSIEQAPRDGERHARLGLVYAVNGLWAEARAALTNALVLRPKDTLARLYLGVAQLELGETAQALATWRANIAAFPEFAPNYYRLGAALLQAGEATEAERAFRRLVELDPGEWRGHAGLGEAALRQGQADESIHHLRRALERAPMARPVHALLAQALRQVGQTNEAVVHARLGVNAVTSPIADAWSKTATQHMKLLPDQVQLANDLVADGDFKEAVAVLAKAFVYHTDNVSLMNQLAIALQRAQQPKKARSIIVRALQQDEKNVPALVTLAMIEHALEDPTKALAAADRAIALAPELAQPQVARANALLGLARDEDALHALGEAARLDPQNPDILVEMGDILWRNLGKPAEALGRYQAAQALDPVHLPARVRTFELSLKQGDLTQAQAALAQLRVIAPGHPAIAEGERRLRLASRATP